MVPFSKSDVLLDANSLYGKAQARNRDYLLSLDVSQLVCDYTSSANLTKCEEPGCPSKGNSSSLPPCTRLPGDMMLGSYYGHYVGHWLSAMAFEYNNSGDLKVYTKSASVIARLVACQTAWGTSS